jgi:hypothetical protein
MLFSILLLGQMVRRLRYWQHHQMPTPTGFNINNDVTVTFSEDIDPATVSSSTFELRNAVIP